MMLALLLHEPRDVVLGSALVAVRPPMGCRPASADSWRRTPAAVIDVQSASYSAEGCAFSA